MIEAIAAMQGILSELSSLAGAASAPAATGGTAGAAAGAPASGSFSDVFAAALDRIDGNIATANQSAKSFAAGADDIPLSDVMVSLEQANLGFQLAATVRDKIVAAYTTVMNMPV
jgi:flagellar hook-basal body complex protein FliE